MLLPEQPAADVTQEELLRDGLRLAAPQGSAFPSRAEPAGRTSVASSSSSSATSPIRRRSCVPERVERCANTLVVTDYDEYVR